MNNGMMTHVRVYLACEYIFMQ